MLPRTQADVQKHEEWVLVWSKGVCGYTRTEPAQRPTPPHYESLASLLRNT